MPYYRNNRCWYIVSLGFSTEISYLISACSEYSIRHRFGSKFKSYKIMPAKSFHLAKVMSGLPFFLPSPEAKANNQWTMNIDGHYIEVIILN